MISPTTPRPLGDVPRAARHRVLRCKGAKQIGAADNSDDAIVAHNRNSLDPMFLKEAGDFPSLGCFGNPDHRCGHDFSSGALRVPEGGKEVRMQRFSFCQQRQPPITPRFATGLGAPEQVALATMPIGVPSPSTTGAALIP